MSLSTKCLHPLVLALAPRKMLLFGRLSGSMKPVLGNLDPYSGTWTRTRLCTQVPEYNTFYKGKKEVGPISMGHTVALINELYFSITCRTCIQWLCLQLSSALGSQIFGFRTLKIPWPCMGAIKVVGSPLFFDRKVLFTLLYYNRIIDSRIKKYQD